MKTFSLSTTQAWPPRLWQAAGLSNSDGAAIQHGLDGKVAALITGWAKISQNDLCKMSGIPSTTLVTT
ncbi:hypothetical protein [Enterobacter sp. RHBSTW-00994]|uniref:hypothetical protein n=1 Tax=Enterobacter sp. RHBSTW-00994 TaxID=2742676 RepID=UPI002016B125|nr:hypothetical protein [Enterobacter sp. RHBSTW-00994]